MFNDLLIEIYETRHKKQIGRRNKRVRKKQSFKYPSAQKNETRGLPSCLRIEILK